MLNEILKSDYIRRNVHCVVSDRDCGSIEIARKYGIDFKIFNAFSGLEFSNMIAEHFNIEKIDLFVSFYTKIFKGNFLKEVNNKLGSQAGALGGLL